MPDADNAADPGVNGEQQANGAPAEAAPVEQQQGSEPQPISRMGALAQALNLPPDVAKLMTEKAESGNAGPRNPEQQPEKEEDQFESQKTRNGDLEGEADASPEQEHEQEEGSPFKDPRVQQRLGKARRQKERLETALEQAERERDELKAKLEGDARQQGPQAPPSKGALGQVTNEADLNRWVSEAETAVDWCDENAEGTTVGEGESAKFISPEEVAKYRRQAEKIVLHAPERRLQIRDSLQTVTVATNHFNGQAKERYPWLFQPESREYAEAMQLMQTEPAVQLALSQNPGFQQSPARNLLLGYVITGMKASRGNAQPGAEPLNPDLPPSLVRKHPPLAPVTAGPPSRSAAPNGTKRVAEAMQTVVTQGGDRESLMAAIRARREAGSLGNTAANGRKLAAV